jgi:hypothetical protein
MGVLQDIVLRVPLINLEDVARIKDALSVEGNDHDSQDPLAHSNFLWNYIPLVFQFSEIDGLDENCHGFLPPYQG